ncbi:aquaporin Z [Elusimicrobium posterum]|uniref:aquaporin n=1 Tax=Elusimicrobium posterum TaxID=3116653 RepID=UPI003C755B4A
MNKKYIAEALGTMFLVLMGCGSAVLAGSGVGLLGISFAFGLTVMVMVYAIGPISGCHINPAITLAMLVNKKISGKDAVGYVVAQFVGAIIGAFALYAIASGLPSYDIAVNGLGTNGYGAATGYCLISAALAEFIFTALFLFVITGACANGSCSGFAGIAIGICLVIIHIVGIPVTGVSVNPARSFGPALVTFIGGNALPIKQVWMFLVVPCLGGVFGAWMWNIVSAEKKSKK